MIQAILDGAEFDPAQQRMMTNRLMQDCVQYLEHNQLAQRIKMTYDGHAYEAIKTDEE